MSRSPPELTVAERNVSQRAARSSGQATQAPIAPISSPRARPTKADGRYSRRGASKRPLWTISTMLPRPCVVCARRSRQLIYCSQPYPPASCCTARASFRRWHRVNSTMRSTAKTSSPATRAVPRTPVPGPGLDGDRCEAEADVLAPLGDFEMISFRRSCFRFSCRVAELDAGPSHARPTAEIDRRYPARR